MGTRPLLLCVAAATLLAVCQSCSVGREFITTFLPNYQGKLRDHKLQLVLTAQDSEANVHIQVGSVKFSKKLTLSAHQTHWVSLPCTSQLVRGGAAANAAVRVSSSADISVVAFNSAHATLSGTVVAPVTQLGVDHVVYTPGGGPHTMDKLVAVTNGDSPNQITFTPAQDVKLQGSGWWPLGGASWPRGKEQRVALAPYQTYLVRTRQNLSGTRIQSQKPVAVLAGHQCLSLGKKCEHVYKQLPPVSRWGKEYLVPSTGQRGVREWAIIVAAEDNTEVSLHRNNKPIQRKLKAGQVVQEVGNSNNPMIVKSNKKVMVLFLSGNQPYDPFLMPLVPSCQLASDWSVETLGGMTSHALLVSEREGAGSVKVCSGGSCASPKWQGFQSDGKWVWSQMPLGTGQGHVTVGGDARMAVYVYGGKSRHGYGTAGVCTEGVALPTPAPDPCDGITCQEKEKCVKGVCVHTSTATCRAVGDPHYQTFDGRRYDFQGTCTYTMATLTEKAAGLTPFTVTTKNNHRGNRRVSFVRTVTVSVYDQTITISRHRGKVQVNGELVYLPVSLSGGKVSVKRSGSYAVLTTDFSLNVKYDWNSRLYITVPSSYYGHLGGLCGNYNGDRKDDLQDLPEPSGTNLARAGVATQSSTYLTGRPQNAIDGSRASNWNQQSLTHTRNDYRPWWRVDLRTAYKVNKVTITNRKDCCANRLNGAEIRIGDSLSDNGNGNKRCAVIPNIGAGVTKTYNCGGMTGRYVNIVIPGRKEHLTLAEVEVYGQASGTNLARAGVATQSSTYLTGRPQNAIDGSRASNWNQQSLTHTRNDYRPWWRVDLRTAYKVNKVTITNRKDCCANRLNGAEIRIGDSLSDNGNGNKRCAVIPNIGAGVTKTYNCGGMTGRYVNIVIPGRKEHLTLAEVEVYGQASGNRLSAVLQMIQQWKVKDSDRFCTDNCGGSCPYCSPTQQTHYQKPSLCGVLVQKDGPFSDCHAAVDPAMYLDNCVYDVCINKGARQVLCDNLKSYADACLSEGVKVNPEWRMAANCPLSCPAGSHYEACGSACPSSCGSLDTEKQCRARCVEGCQCDEGRVLSGDKCVPKSSCGCQHQGRYYPPGTTFWADNGCTTKCSCNRGKVTCKAVSCKKNERCAVKGGVRNCYPVSFATCQGTGDPHYRTFDGRRFDFQGTCTYVLSQLVKGSDPDLVPFQVLVQNENRGRNKAVSYTKSVSITVYNNTISMSSDNPGKVLVNGRYVNLPYTTPGEELSIHRRGYFGFVQTAFGLTLKFNWRSHVGLTLPSIYSNAVAGLCGNYNKNSKDDFQKPDGSQAKKTNTFGHSWKAGGGLGCTSDCPGGKCPECEPAKTVLYQKKQYCGIISDQAGPFRQCHAKLDHTEFLHDCVYDMCAYKGQASALCGSLSAFSTACQEAGATVDTWRTKDFCPPSCGPNSHYETCAAPCPQTCSGLVSPQGCEEEEEAGVCTEACVCDDGFVLSDDTCVPVAECGCQYEGQYYHKGQVVYPGRGCSKKCTCLDNGQMKCDAFTCLANEKCDVSEGVATCVPRSRGSCSVGGARTVTSFDGQVYPLWGDCIFTLSEVEENNGELTAFSVLLRQHVAKDGGVTRSVEIQAYDYEIAMETGVLWEVKLDDVRASLPLSLGEGKVRVNQNGINIVVETDFGLTVTYDSIAGVVVQLPSTYRSAPRGLCGDYNNKSSDDFVVPNETEPVPLEVFTAAWTVQRTGVVCKTGCGDASCPEPSGQKAPECDVIKARQGPFAGCHAAIPPTPRYDACVKEMSTGGGGRDILCRHIQAYVSSCQSAGASVSSWRTDTFCPLTCPAGSHYELCADTCSSSCSFLLSPGHCPRCHEGCQCDEGLAFDGGRCVPVEKCGCMVDGVYYKSGVSVLRDDCSESCECQSGRFSCKEHSCQEGEECGVKDGNLGCHTTDPCAEVECREKESCEVQEGEAVCVAQSKAVCYGFGDPHYSTFDGWSYSFQGTCSYVLVNTTGRDPSLPEVTVTVKNELRGNDVGSFTRSASVDLLGHRINIPRGQSGTVEVDGIRMHLPIILDGGSISITESGIRGTLQANIGVEVTFDWSTLIMVSVSSSFHGNLGGLCGNYNGDRDDELATPTGTAATSVMEWAKSWSVADDDAFCHHQCEGKCQQCATQDRLRLAGPQYCGVLSNKTGPFSGCHGKVPVKQFAQDCLYDLCVNDGRQEVLCEVLTSYVAECQELGVNVPPWRETANCPLVCPANSHYETCGTSCPETCGPKPETCPKICVEGCFCDKGYVLSGEKCVIREKGCGCNHEDRYYLPGEVFWADKQCRSKCLCNAAAQKVQCEPWGCKAGEHCSVVDGVQDCYPVTFHTCQAQGDPHFKTFDGRKFDFQGNCVYRLASVCRETEGLEHFEVSLENNNRGSTRVSYAKVVTVNVYGQSFTLALDYPGQVLVDGEAVYLPYSSNRSLVRVHRGNRLAVIETHFLKVSYDWRSLVRVQVASTYQNTLCGLCGNHNGDPKDDLTLPNGKAASSAKEFGVSQWLANVPSCSHECKDCPPELLRGVKPPAFTAVCDVIVSKDGPLQDCVSRVDSEQFRSDCIYDMMQTNGKEASACDIIADYVQECQEVGGKVENWRTKDFCWMKCPVNSQYSLAAPGCPVTCSIPASKCRVLPSEGCVCNNNYLLSQDRCVRLSQCGCQFEGRYVPSGENFYADAGCQRFCVCRGGTVSCRDKPCKGNKKCGMRKGKRCCYSPKKGFSFFGAIKNVVEGVFKG